VSALAVAVLDYGSGNLHSLAKALRAGGADVRVTSDVEDALAADALVLPGVGAFGDAAARLLPALPALRGALAAGLPCLGICLGMQLLFEDSEEGGGEGLGVLPGRVRRLVAGRLPHMGWNDVEPVVGVRGGRLASAEDEQPWVAYFAHSYVADPRNGRHVLAWTAHEGTRFPAIVGRGRVRGVQFHPEKSGEPGLRFLGRFLEEARCS
jgi:glutamine amidotransferase